MQKTICNKGLHGQSLLPSFVLFAHGDHALETFLKVEMLMKETKFLTMKEHFGSKQITIERIH